MILVALVPDGASAPRVADLQPSYPHGSCASGRATSPDVTPGLPNSSRESAAIALTGFPVGQEPQPLQTPTQLTVSQHHRNASAEGTMVVNPLLYIMYIIGT